MEINTGTDAAGLSREPAPNRAAALKGSAITLVTHFASTGIRFGSNLLLTRILLPEHFGLMALVNVFLIGLHLFSDIGVGPNIIQSRRGDDPLFLNTAWTVQAIRGVMLWGFSCLLAWPLARFYDTPALLGLIPVAGFGAVIGGLESTRLFTQNRHLAFGGIALVEIISQVAGVIVTLAGAWWTRSVWALVAGAMVGATTKTVLSHLLLPGIANRFGWDADARKQLFDFGRWIFVSTAFTFLASQSDRLVLGKLFPAALLGLYAIAANLAALPMQIIGQLANRVFYPVVASAMRRDDYDVASIRRARARLLMVIAPAMGMGIAMSPPMVQLLYDVRYHDVGPLVSLLLVGTWLSAIGTSYATIVLAAGQPKYMSFGNALKFVLFIGPVFFVSDRFGVRGVALLLSLAELGVIAALLVGCRGLGVITWQAEIGMSAVVVASAGLCWGLHRVLVSLTGMRLPPVIVVALLTMGVCGLLVRRLRVL